MTFPETLEYFAIPHILMEGLKLLSLTLPSIQTHPTIKLLNDLTLNVTNCETMVNLWSTRGGRNALDRFLRGRAVSRMDSLGFLEKELKLAREEIRDIEGELGNDTLASLWNAFRLRFSLLLVNPFQKKEGRTPKTWDDVDTRLITWRTYCNSTFDALKAFDDQRGGDFTTVKLGGGKDYLRVSPGTTISFPEGTNIVVIVLPPTCPTRPPRLQILVPPSLLQKPEPRIRKPAPIPSLPQTPATRMPRLVPPPLLHTQTRTSYVPSAVIYPAEAAPTFNASAVTVDSGTGPSSFPSSSERAT